MGIEKRVVSVRIAPETLDKIKQLAKLHQRSRSNMIQIIIEEGLKYVTKDSKANK